MKTFKYIIPFVLFLQSCKGFDNNIAKKDFLEECKDCEVVEVTSEECKDGSILSCMMVIINYTQNSDSIKTVICQYIKDDKGVWRMSK